MGTVAQMNEAAEEVTVADVDDAPVPNDRPRRINARKGIDRLQMYFQVLKSLTLRHRRLSL